MADETNPGNGGTGNTPPAKEETPAPNIVFVGKGDIDPPTKIQNAVEKIKLPKVEDQVEISVNKETGRREFKGKPFYHEKAGTIVQLFGMYYKHFKPKGE